MTLASRYVVCYCDYKTGLMLSQKERMIADALDNWVVSGTRTDLEGRQSQNYWAYSSVVGMLVRVAVSMDDADDGGQRRGPAPRGRR